MVSPATLPSLAARLSVERSGDTAFIEGDRRWSYAEFEAETRRAAAWLAGHGVRRGDRVAVWLPNGVTWLALFFGLARLGAVMMSVNTRFRSSELEYVLKKSRAAHLIMQPGFRRIDFRAIVSAVDPAAVPDLRSVIVVDPSGEADATAILGRPTVALRLDAAGLDEAGLDEAGGAPAEAAEPDLPCILFTTSGTTKGPKLVIHPQRTLVFHSGPVAARTGLDQPGARLLAMLPFCGVFGLVGTLAAFAAGTPVVILDTFDAERAAALIGAHGVTHTFGSDEMYRRLLQARAGDRPFPTARLFGFAAFQPGAIELATEAWARGVPMVGLYGSSEVQALFAIQPEGLPLEERILGGGLPSAGELARVRVRDVDTGDLLPPGRSGEIEIAAPGNFAGYLDDPEATAEVMLPDGFFRTGDVGHLRADGSFVYEMRKGDAIRLGGYLVSPVEIEDVLKGFDGVADAQVVAVAVGTELKPVAFVIPQPGAAIDPDALVARARGCMAGFKVPYRVWPVEAFPTTESANGTKIQRARLRTMAEERLAREG
ncbi:AMP-binding protein [Azospirillum sp.]|uniref:AMP-binding protein n=1 Tax=Azospirillum sp. TaxID=34012 RepID=UPI002D3181EC|nr:AMP-binding protein [Azospirillum sp.]HYD64640.1 AMP-binding protein [Azospirillum sp.]